MHLEVFTDKLSLYIYIYIYIERERERERVTPFLSHRFSKDLTVKKIALNSN